MLPFSKYHGLGNDFILLDRSDLPGELTADRVRELCDRHTGIGADGILIREPSDKADHRMILWNSDGSRAEISGNGLRCFVMFLRDRGLFSGGELVVETGAGVMRASLHKETQVETTMPVAAGLAGGHKPEMVHLKARDLTFEVVPINVGNPHGVIFGSKRDIPFAEKYGPELERDPHFPEGANIQFAHLVDRKTCDLVIWERGAGITMACGSGSVATACAGAAMNYFDFEVPICVRMPGGKLFIMVGKGFSQILQRGEAVFAFSGTI